MRQLSHLLHPARGSHAVYRAALPLSRKTLAFVSGIIRRDRVAVAEAQSLEVRERDRGPPGGLRPKLREAGRDAKRVGYAYVVVDGTLIPIDRVAADRPFYSGKHKKHGMNLQVIPSPNGDILWVSGALPNGVALSFDVVSTGCGS
jgi:DDE superfamily endonuclease